MKILGLILCFLFFGSAFGQESKNGESISYRKYKESHPDKISDFAIKADLRAIKANESIHYKYSNNDWHFIRCSPAVLSELLYEGLVSQIYFTPSKPALLSDTMRIVQNIDSVHNGDAPLISEFTGKDIVIGYVDTGIDHNHADFKNADGSSRVLYYWDHTLPDRFHHDSLNNHQQRC